ncbi:N-methyl-D-aspartate receptor NMDAR2C subunit [Candidatus Woesearchaeota archaeon]|nr:N-methyl-D-aspartate receptor NMDAR2C subunit [Candidatus Woesearchaeota archaeon]
MKERFFRFWDQIEARDREAQKAFDLLRGMYNESHRFYHNLNHIMNCLDEFDRAQSLAEHPHELEFAIGYHDAVYDTKANNNEERSARLAYNLCKKAGLSNDFAEKARDLVLVTRHAEVHEGVDEKLMLDIDLSILGKPAEEFGRYEEAIRKEYSWVPEEGFRKGRREILQRFLDKPNIYLTNFFRKKYEEQARKNLEKAVRQLSS